MGKWLLVELPYRVRKTYIRLNSTGLGAILQVMHNTVGSRSYIFFFLSFAKNKKDPADVKLGRVDRYEVALERSGMRSPSVPGVYPDNVGRGAPDGFAERGPQCFRHLRCKVRLLISSILRS